MLPPLSTIFLPEHEALPSWWSRNASLFPHVGEPGPDDVLAQPASSDESERLFSMVGQIITKKGEIDCEGNE